VCGTCDALSWQLEAGRVAPCPPTSQTGDVPPMNKTVVFDVKPELAKVNEKNNLSKQ